MLTPADPSSFTNTDEGWKSQVGAPVKMAVSKFETLFDEDTRSRVTRALENGIFKGLKERAVGESGGVLFSGAGGTRKG
jgi:hypothetical protein